MHRRGFIQSIVAFFAGRLGSAAAGSVVASAAADTMCLSSYCWTHLSAEELQAQMAHFGIDEHTANGLIEAELAREAEIIV